MSNEITLTKDELEEIKDDVRYREKTTLTLKHLCQKIDTMNGTVRKIPVINTHIKIHYWLIALIITGIVGSGILGWVFRIFAK